MRLDRLIVIGGGNMARAIVGGAVAGGLVSPGGLIVAEPDPERRTFFQSIGGHVVTSTVDLLDRLADDTPVLLAVKPQMLGSVGAEIAGAGRPFGGLVVSILAGMTSERVRAAFGGHCRVVRVMPNTPATVRMGISGVCGGSTAEPRDLMLVESLFGGVGTVLRVCEDQMDAVTAVSGSGPAYVFLLAQAMLEGAQSVGLGEVESDRLVRATIRGAAELLASSDRDPGALREAVTSPGGTTAAAIEVMESAGLRGTIADAIRAARDRGAELGA